MDKFASEEEREYAIEILARALTRLVKKDNHFNVADCKATCDAQYVITRIIVYCSRLDVKPRRNKKCPAK